MAPFSDLRTLWDLFAFLSEPLTDALPIFILGAGSGCTLDFALSANTSGLLDSVSSTDLSASAFSA